MQEWMLLLIMMMVMMMEFAEMAKLTSLIIADWKPLMDFLTLDFLTLGLFLPLFFLFLLFNLY